MSIEADIEDAKNRVTAEHAPAQPAGVAPATPVSAAHAAPAPVPVTPAAPAPVPVTPVAPAPVPVTPTTPAPVTPAAPPTPVPTAAPTYTFDQIATAGAALLDAGKQPELLGLLSQFGVQALTQLRPEQLGPFATALRGLGARI